MLEFTHEYYYWRVLLLGSIITEPTCGREKRILHSNTVLCKSTFVVIERSAVKRYTDVRIVDVRL